MIVHPPQAHGQVRNDPIRCRNLVMGQCVPITPDEVGRPLGAAEASQPKPVENGIDPPFDRALCGCSHDEGQRRDEHCPDGLACSRQEG